MKSKTMGYNNRHLSDWIIAGTGSAYTLFRFWNDYVPHYLMDVVFGPDFPTLLLKGFLSAGVGGAGAWLGKKLLEIAWKAITGWWRDRKECRRKLKNP